MFLEYDSRRYDAYEKKIIVSVLCFALLGFSVRIYAEAEGKNKGPNFWLGRTILSQLNNETMIYAKGKDIEITEKELNDHAARLINAGGREREEAYKEAYDVIVRRKTLLHAALQAGYAVSDEELDQIIEKEKENLQDPDVKEQAEELYEGFGGEEAYWEYIREIKRETVICSKYINDKEKEYREAYEKEELISYGEDGSVHDAWEKEKEKLIQQLVTEQQMEIIKEEK